MEDFNLVLQELITKDVENLNIPLSDSLKKDFESTAQRYVENGNLLNAIKVFAITKNKAKLIETANICLKQNLPYEAFTGFYHANDQEQLNKIGFIMLQIPDVETALKAFKEARNQEMILFLESNLI